MASWKGGLALLVGAALSPGCDGSGLEPSVRMPAQVYEESPQENVTGTEHGQKILYGPPVPLEDRFYLVRIAKPRSSEEALRAYAPGEYLAAYNINTTIIFRDRDGPLMEPKKFYEEKYGEGTRFMMVFDPSGRTTGDIVVYRESGEQRSE